MVVMLATVVVAPLRQLLPPFSRPPVLKSLVRLACCRSSLLK
jgi:hypothetical protein